MSMLKAMLKVQAVPAFNNNYLWLIHNGRQAVVVDPGDAKPILTALATHGLSLVGILLTHHHADHVGGVPELLQGRPIPVFGPRHDDIAAVTVPLDEGDTAHIAQLGLTFSVIAVPGHTRGHIAFFEPKQNWLFCGDTLFAGGCGRIFEGTPEQMAQSLEKLAALPEQTQVYCAHEYTLSNLRFAQVVDADNQALHARMAAEQAKRQAGQPTVPSTIGLEKATNPFIRYRDAHIMRYLISAGRLQQADPLAAFAALREWKNSFK